MIKKVRDIAGQKFGRVTAVRFLWVKKHNAYWLGKCECGSALITRGSNLRLGETKSCGCLQPDAVRAASKTHGRSKAPEFNIWQHMKRRCHSPSDDAYCNYGGRGISVCSEWAGPTGFARFLADMGPRPSAAHSIERIDNDGDYGPTNCRWATRGEQVKNMRRTVHVQLNGRRMIQEEAARALGVNSGTVHHWLKGTWRAPANIALRRVS